MYFKSVYKLLICVALLMSGCEMMESKIIDNNEKKIEEIKRGVVNNKVIFMINNQQYNAVLFENETTKALLDIIPTSFNMNDLNGNEKYYYLVQTLPTNDELVKEVKAGDLLLFGSNCLVIFYKDAKTSYAYTKIGYLENNVNLKALEDLKKINVAIKIRQL